MGTPATLMLLFWLVAGRCALRVGGLDLAGAAPPIARTSHGSLTSDASAVCFCMLGMLSVLSFKCQSGCSAVPRERPSSGWCLLEPSRISHTSDMAQGQWEAAYSRAA